MGIPKFYRWLSERYPLLNQKLTLTEGPPEMDNLYLDMNGIIHNCTHANRKDIGSVTEEDMMLKVFDYLEKLIQIVRPQKLLFMAIDGVAPRAKMNQQRSRRFKSAMERLKNEEEQRKKGVAVPDDPFDSNCITPGTEFMARLGKHLRFFIRRKMADDPLWQKPNVVFSGHEVPGEGEHKIMEYIRWEKRQPSYQPNQRHCMYGLDADLIMLSLVTHEPHFCLLREVVSYTGSNRGQPAREVLENPCAENFILFQIGLLREYFELEFSSIKLPFAFDLERIVDDYVLMCMLVGNDFLPALPTLDIAEGALNKLMDLYKELLPSLGGYLTYAGELDRRRLEMLVERIGQLELQTLEERAQDAEYMENKRAKRAARMGGGTPAGSGTQLDEIDAGMRALAVSGRNGNGNGNGALAGLLNEALEPEGGPGSAPAAPAAQQGPTMMSREARQMVMAGMGAQGLQMWKDRYYNEKLHAFSPEERREVVEHYIAGLHWVLEYYYRGVASWDWYYPYHYAPMASDMTNLDVIQVAFAQGTPFRPFEQLLAVLPAASCKLLPPPFRILMTDPESPVIDFYPATFEVDMEGKRADWEGVVLVPFVDEVRLLKAVSSVSTALMSAEELARNQPGQIQIFQHSRDASEPKYCTSTMTKHFRDLKVCHSRCIEKPPPPPLPIGGKGFTPVLVPGTRVGLSTPLGMPTLKSLQVRPAMRNAGVNVLGTPSRKESLVLGLRDLREALGGAVLSAEQVARSGLLGSRAYINWPYLQEARVVRVSDRGGQVLYDSKGEIKVQKWQQPEAQRWDVDAGHLASTFLTRSGIDVGKVDLVVSVKVCLGYIRHSDGTIEKTYSRDEVQVPLQAVIRQRPQQAGNGAPAADDVPGYPDLYEGMQVVFLGKHHYGCMATVLPDLGKGLGKQDKQPNQSAKAANGHYRLLVQPVTDQAGVQALRMAKRVVESFAVKYYNSSQIANRLRVTPRLLGRITGNMWARDGDDRYDLGLAIKTSSKDVCVPGFSQPSEDGNGWTYSAAVITILEEYRTKHPWVWAHMVKSESDGPGDMRLDQLLPGLTPAQRKDKVKQVAEWIQSTPLAKRPLVKLGVKVLSDEGVRALQTAVSPIPARPPAAAEYENVPPALILPPYTPGADQVKLAVQGGSFELGDRVVCVSGKGSPPYGLRGTVIGVYEEACEVVFDEDFSGGSNLNGRVNGKCGAFVPKDMLLCVNKPADISLAKHQLPRQQQSKQPAAAKPSPTGSAPTGAAAAAAAASKPDANANANTAARAAAKAMQQRPAPSPASTAASPCVPAAAAVSAPISPPVPSTKLLGAAMRSIANQSPSAQQQAQQQDVAAAGAGRALLHKLTSAAASPARGQGAEAGDEAAASAAATAAAAAAAVAAATQPSGSLAQLQRLVPNARVGDAGQGGQQRPLAAAPNQQRQSPPAPPPPVAQQYQWPGFPAPGGMMPPPPHPMAQMHMQMMPPPGAYPPMPAYGMPPPIQWVSPVPYPPMGVQGMHPMPMPGNGMGMPQMPPPGAMPPGGMMGQPGGVPYMAPPPPQAHAPPRQPPQAGPGPVQHQQRPAAPHGQANGAAAVNGRQEPKQGAPASGKGRGDKGKGADAGRQGGPAPAPRQAQVAGGKGPSGAAVAAAAAGATPSLPAPASHPIEVDQLQSMDESDEAAQALLRKVRDGAAPQAQAPTVGAAPKPSRMASGKGASPAHAVSEDEPVRPVGSSTSSAFGVSAKLPDAEGRGFRGRGRAAAPPPPPGAPALPAAPGSLAAAPSPAAAAVAAADAALGRASLDGIQAGQSLLRSLQSGAGPDNKEAATANRAEAGRFSLDGIKAGQSLLRSLQSGALAPAAAQANGGQGGAAPTEAAAGPAAPPSSPGAALLRQLQGADAASGSGSGAAKVQSLDSGAELLRALQRAPGP